MPNDANEDEPPMAKFLSYCCYFRCGPAHEVGFIDPGEAREHMRTAHRSQRNPIVKKWPHSVEVYEHFGVEGPL